MNIIHSILIAILFWMFVLTANYLAHIHVRLDAIEARLTSPDKD